MTRRLRILVTARDMGAATNLAPVVRALRQRQDCLVTLAAQPPALDWLRRTLANDEVELLAFDQPLATHSAQAAPLLQAARELLEQTRPDAVLAGLASPGAGVDEAVLATADMPALAFQDYWGDVNLTLGKPASLYLVRDALAAQLTLARAARPSRVVGMPKYEQYAALDPSALRRSGRALLGGDAMAVGFFGQPLGALAGYARSAARLGRVVAAAFPGARLFFAPHPKEGAPEEMAKALGASGAPAAIPPFARVEEALLACDVAVTCFSSCGEDLSALHEYCAAPEKKMVHLLFEPDIRHAYTASTGLTYAPMARQGRAIEVRSPDGLGRALREAASPPQRAPGGVLPPPSAVQAVVNAVLESARAWRQGNES